MATRKQARQKSLLQILALLIAVVIIIVAAILVQNWWTSRPGPEPHDVAITATNGEQAIDVAPYMVCELGTECQEGDVPTLLVGPDDNLVLDIPEDIHDHDWQLLTIYDDPAANDQVFHGSYDAEQVEIPGSTDPIGDSEERPNLMVVEISSVMIGHDEDNEETPYATVWSLATMEQGDNAQDS